MVAVRLPGVTIDTEESPFQLVKVTGLTETTAPRIQGDEREQGHGDFGQADIFQAARHFTVEGEYYQQYEGEDLTAAGDVLKRLTGEHFEVSFDTGFRVYRSSVVLASAIRWDRAAPVQRVVPFDFTLKADDPRLYGEVQRVTVNPPQPGVGMSDRFTDPFDEGEPGTLGRVVVTNNGSAPSEPRMQVTGGLPEGFEIQHLEAGRVIRVTRPVLEGSHVLIDHGAGQAWIDGQSQLPAAFLPVAEWFQVGKGEQATFQWRPLGGVSGSPQLTVEFSEASW